jgi:hypothetical protein
VLKPGKPKNVDSYVNLENTYGIEGSVAAYCGFNDVGKFRTFYTSAHVLPYFTEIFCSFKGYSRKTVLGLLEDAPYGKY